MASVYRSLLLVQCLIVCCHAILNDPPSPTFDKRFVAPRVAPHGPFFHKTSSSTSLIGTGGSLTNTATGNHSFSSTQTGGSFAPTGSISFANGTSSSDSGAAQITPSSSHIASGGFLRNTPLTNSSSGVSTITGSFSNSSSSLSASAGSLINNTSSISTTAGSFTNSSIGNSITSSTSTGGSSTITGTGVLPFPVSNSTSSGSVSITSSSSLAASGVLLGNTTLANSSTSVSATSSSFTNSSISITATASSSTITGTGIVPFPADSNLTSNTASSSTGTGSLPFPAGSNSTSSSASSSTGTGVIPFPAGSNSTSSSVSSSTVTSTSSADNFTSTTLSSSSTITVGPSSTSTPGSQSSKSSSSSSSTSSKPASGGDAGDAAAGAAGAAGGLGLGLGLGLGGGDGAGAGAGGTGLGLGSEAVEGGRDGEGDDSNDDDNKKSLSISHSSNTGSSTTGSSTTGSSTGSTISSTSNSITSSSLTSTSSISSSSTVTGQYCSIGGSCNGGACGSTATAVAAARRDLSFISGRLLEPKDLIRDDLIKRSQHLPRNDIPKRYNRFVRDDITKASLWERGYIPQPSDADFANNINNFITEVITFPGAKPVLLPSINPDSTAIVVRFDSPPDENYYPSVSGLEGCTSVVIIGENGCWLSHFWEAPWFLGASQRPEAFIQNVITPLENGNGANMPSPFAAGGQSQRIPELAAGQKNFQPEIRIFTRMDKGAITYADQIAQISQALTGPGRAFAGVPVTTTGYVRQEPDSRLAKGKILVQYTNDQQDDMGDQLVCPQSAIYKIWFEENLISEHAWPAIGDQMAFPNAKTKMRRANVCGPANYTSSSSSPATGLPATPVSLVVVKTPLAASALTATIAKYTSLAGIPQATPLIAATLATQPAAQYTPDIGHQGRNSPQTSTARSPSSTALPSIVSYILY